MKIAKNMLFALSCSMALNAMAAPALFNGLYDQNFNSLGASGTAFPAGFSLYTISGGSSNAAPPTPSQMNGATLGSSTLAAWNQTSSAATYGSQAYNGGTSSTDLNRLLGTSPTGTLGSIIQLELTNDTGTILSEISVSYDMKAMKNGTKKSGATGSVGELPGYSFFILDGASWIHVNDLDLANTTLDSVGVASDFYTFTNPVSNGGTIKVRWYDDNDDPLSPDNMIAIDNVNVSAVPEPASLSLLALGGLSLLRRRR